MTQEVWFAIGLAAGIGAVVAAVYAYLMAKAAEFFDEWEDR